MGPTAKKPRTGKKYSEEDFQKAYRAISEGKLSLCKASKQFNIPKTTLHERISNSQLEKPQRGTCTVLTKGEEERLSQWVLTSWQCGFQNIREHIISDEAKYLLQKSGRKDLRNGTFSRRWYVGFCKRHPEVHRAVAQQAHPNAALWNFNLKQLECWFDRIKGFLIKEIGTVAIRPQRMFHCLQNSAEEVSVLLSYAASGEVIPPLLVLPSNGKDLDLQIPQQWFLRTQWKTCLIDQQVLQYYLTEVLHPFLKAQKYEFPVLIYLDHQQQPLPLSFVEDCSKLGLILINLYYKAFEDLKLDCLPTISNTSSSSLDYFSYIENLKHGVLTLNKTRIRQAFLEAGLFPFDCQNVDSSRYLRPHSHSLNHESASMHVDSHFNLNFQLFKKIVGSSILIDLEEYQMLREQDHQEQQYTPEFICLSKIYEKFKGAMEVISVVEHNSDEQTELESLLND